MRCKLLPYLVIGVLAHLASADIDFKLGPTNNCQSFRVTGESQCCYNGSCAVGILSTWESGCADCESSNANHCSCCGCPSGYISTTGAPSCDPKARCVGCSEPNEVLVGNSSSTWQCMEHCTPAADSCKFYQCLEANHDCQKTDYKYPIAYGFKYCEAFFRTNNEFSLAGKQWVLNARLCLQKALESDAASTASCKQIEDSAFKSHPHCYYGNGTNGICNLPSQWPALLQTIGPGALISHPSQIVETAELCVEFWDGLADSDLEEIGRHIENFLSETDDGINKAILGSIAGHTSKRLSSLLARAGVSVSGL